MDGRILVEKERVLFEYRKALRRNPDDDIHLYADRFPEEYRDVIN